MHRIAANTWRLERATRAETEHLNVIQERAVLEIAERDVQPGDPLLESLAPLVSGVNDNMALPMAEECHRIWQVMLNASDHERLPLADGQAAVVEAIQFVSARFPRASQPDETTSLEECPTTCSSSSSGKEDASSDSRDDTQPVTANSPASEMPSIAVADVKRLLAKVLQPTNALIGVPHLIMLMAKVAAQRVGRLRRMAFRQMHDLDHYRRQDLLPDDSTMRAVIRSESHCRRMLEKDIQELERLQNNRLRNNPPAAAPSA